jgi:hypothetical protein
MGGEGQVRNKGACGGDVIAQRDDPPVGDIELPLVASIVALVGTEGDGEVGPFYGRDSEAVGGGLVIADLDVLIGAHIEVLVIGDIDIAPLQGGRAEVGPTRRVRQEGGPYLQRPREGEVPDLIGAGGIGEVLVAVQHDGLGSRRLTRRDAQVVGIEAAVGSGEDVVELAIEIGGRQGVARRPGCYTTYSTHDLPLDYSGSRRCNNCPSVMPCAARVFTSMFWSLSFCAICRTYVAIPCKALELAALPLPVKTFLSVGCLPR